MNTFHRTTAALLATLTLGLIPPTSPAPAQPDTAPIETPTQTQATATETATEADNGVTVGIHTVHGANAQALNRIENALTTFQNAGLDLPQLTITVYPNLDGCNGLAGTYIPNTTQGDQVNLCSRAHPDFTILHELAHAWEAHNINNTTRNTFLKLQNLNTWFGSDVDWNERGGEQAAETIAKGLLNRPYPNIHLDAIDLLETGYQLLTGNHSPRYNNTPNPQINQLPTTIG